MYKGMTIALISILTGCSSSPADLEAKATPTIRTYVENYQEIYRRTSTAAKRCIAENVSAQASMAVDSDLYPDLGYGEITVSMINWGTRNYYLTSRIERISSGARMTVRSGNLPGNGMEDSMLRWAKGDQACRI